MQAQTLVLSVRQRLGAVEDQVRHRDPPQRVDVRRPADQIPLLSRPAQIVRRALAQPRHRLAVPGDIWGLQIHPVAHGGQGGVQLLGVQGSARSRVQGIDFGPQRLRIQRNLPEQPPCVVAEEPSQFRIELGSTAFADYRGRCLGAALGGMGRGDIRNLPQPDGSLDVRAVHALGHALAVPAREHLAQREADHFGQAQPAGDQRGNLAVQTQ